MEPQQPHQPRPRPSHPHLHHILPPPPSHVPHRTANSTPVSSPGLFSPAAPRSTMSLPASQPGSESTTPGGLNSPYLHPLQSHKVRETHKANVEHDNTTGRKLINSYEIIEELGRGMHGKVKLARNQDTGDYVAIKIIPRLSKRRRLGKVSAMSTQDKSKREIAILKKIRHPNVVALLEIIDDPELKKIYMVLEHVELGEIVWRKKGLPHICAYERRRVEREMRGEQASSDDDRYERMLERRQALKYAKRAKIMSHASSHEHWSLECGADVDDDRLLAGEDVDVLTRQSPPGLDSPYRRDFSRAPSRTPSSKSISARGTPQRQESNLGPLGPDEEDLETPAALRPNPLSSTALDTVVPYDDNAALRGRSPSMADSIISHMSSLDFGRVQDPYVDDFSYVPCFSIEQARQTFRDTVLGLEYLHYQGVVHRDIKPANLLWTKDHRVKISDFGVSYFGRPMREGDADETVSESEARDFDNDLELAKTVGTPAFFAPELCYTDDIDGQPNTPPKITEQIDVWSLGVTLYCLIFARIPFLAEDEWQMFKKIAKEDVYIPKKRLRPVDPSTKPDEKSLYTRVNSEPYRDDDVLAYEDISDDLQDLLAKMLTKNPEKRIRLRDVKRHAWVVHGIPNVISWLDDTDPSRRTSGRKIQVDDREVAGAVVPLTLLERARSAVKKVVDKVMHARSERTESVSSRRRADSTATSSAGDSPVAASLGSSHPRDGRRRSIRPDDYFTSLLQQQPPPSGHPLTHSVVASPREVSPVRGSSPARQQPQSATSGPRQLLDLITGSLAREDHSDRHPSSAPALSRSPRHGHTRSVTNAFLTLTPTPYHETWTVPPTPLFDSAADPGSALRKARDMRPAADDASGRARSMDRGLFSSADKRAEARVSLSTATAPGNVHFTHRPRPSRSIELSNGFEGLGWPAAALASGPLVGYQHGHPQSDPSIHKQRVPVELEDRPMTAHRVEDAPGNRTPQQVRPKSFIPGPSPFAYQLGAHRDNTDAIDAEPTLVPCPPSPDDDIFRPMPVSRGETIATAKSSSSASIGTLTTPLTSPSETASPVYGANASGAKNATHMLAFQSDPSLPALLSSTSSVSADLEGEFLGNPGVVRPSVTDTTDSLTPPAFAKEPISGFPLEVQEQVRQGAVPVQLDERRVGQLTSPPHMRRVSHLSRADDDDESDSDEGLTMPRKSKKHYESRLVGLGQARRRDTIASVGSTETAKRLVVDDD